MNLNLLILTSGFMLYVLAPANPKTIAFLLAEKEYETEKNLPQFAKKNLSPGFNLKYCLAPKEGAGRNFLGNYSEISTADLLFISVRRRAFKEKTMNLIREHISLGKSIIALRTSSHAFDLRKSPVPKGHQTWPRWDRDIIGGNYNGHHSKGITCNIERVPASVPSPLLKGVQLPFNTPGTLYKNSPLPPHSVAILTGSIAGFQEEPVAWTHRTASGSKVFYTSLGHTEDFQKKAFTQLLLNAIHWSMEK